MRCRSMCSAFSRTRWICASYKWLLGPYSIGVAYFGPRYDDGVPLEDGCFGRVGSEDFRRLVEYQDHYRSGAARYDVGERANFILVPMLIAALEQVLSWNLEDVQTYCRSITHDLFGEMGRIGFAVEDPAWRGAHLFGLHAPAHIDIATVAARLREQRVFVSCAAVRFGSPRTSTTMPRTSPRSPGSCTLRLASVRNGGTWRPLDRGRRRS